MDAELREYLDGKFKQIDDRFAQVDARFAQVDARFAQVDARFAQVDEKFIALEHRFDDKLTSLAQLLLHEIDTRLSLQDKRFESIDSRIKLHAGLIQSGSRAITRLTDFSETSEARYIELLSTYDNLERRIVKLESPAQN